MPPATRRPRMLAPAAWLTTAVVMMAFVTIFEPIIGWLDPMRFVKLLAVAGAAALALAFHRLLEALAASGRTRRTAALLALPLIVFDALLLGGTDAIHVAACMMAVAMAVERRHAAMFAWWGIAFAFAAQALLLAPFFLALAIQRRIALRRWLAISAAMPAMLLSASLPSLATGPASRAPNIWSLVAMVAPEHAPSLLALTLAAALGTIAAYVARMQSIAADRAGLAGLAALALLLTAGLLPHMGAQDFLLAGVLTLAAAVARPTRSALTLAALVQLGAAAAIAGGFGVGIPLAAIGALCMIAATWLAAQPLIAPHANDNCDGSHAIPLPHGLRGTLSFDMMSRPVVWPRGE